MKHINVLWVEWDKSISIFYTDIIYRREKKQQSCYLYSEKEKNEQKKKIVVQNQNQSSSENEKSGVKNEKAHTWCSKNTISLRH